MRVRIAVVCLCIAGAVAAWNLSRSKSNPAQQGQTAIAAKDPFGTGVVLKPGPRPSIMIADGVEIGPVEPMPAEPGPGMLLTPEQIARQDAINNDPNSVTVGTPWIGEVGITETIEQIMAREAEEQARRGNAPYAAHNSKPELMPKHRKNLPSAPGAPAVSQWPPAAEIQGAAQADPTGLLRPLRPDRPFLPQTISTSFQAIQLSESGAVPPDTEGDVSPTQILVALNGRFKSFSKAGGLGALNTGASTFFNSVRNGAGVSDPRVIYDRTAQRWFIAMVNVAIPNRLMIAVSNGPTFTNSTSFTFFFFVADTVAPARSVNSFLDYPSLGVDEDALYIGGNTFNSALNSFLGCDGYVVQKSSLLSGGPIVVNAFRNMCTGGGAGPFAARGVTSDQTGSTEGYFLGVDNAAFSRLVVRRITSPDTVTPAISGNLNITVPTTTSNSSIPCLGSTNNLDALDDRLYAAKIFHNRLTGTRTLWAAHNFRVSSAGTASTGVGNRHGTRWYELGSLTGTPALIQSGTVFDDAASNPDHHWIGSVAMNGQGHAALGCSRAGVNRRAEIAVTGRLSSGALGTMDAPSVIAQTSTTSYNTGLQGSVYRWGDYSATSVDPADQMSIWTFQEYCNANNSWAIRAIKLLAPPPATPDSANPPQVAQGATNVNVDVTGVSSAGSGFFDPDVSYPNHISASVDGTGVTVNSVTFTDPTHITLNISVTGGATPGLRNITVTNPDGQVATSGGGILEVVAPCSLPGDVNTNGTIDADDVQGFVDCVLTGSTSSGDCACANITLAAFLGLLL